MGYVELALAIVGEVIGTNFMKASAGFTRLVPSVVTVVAYIACFYFFAQSLKTVNLSVAYATWGGLGIILTSIIAVTVWHESISWPELLGIVLIIAGVILCNFFSNAH
jgi:small multidrug resistance pump